MDKYKTNSAFNKWFSAIKLENLSVYSKKWILDYNSYRKKLSFESVLKLFLYVINEEKESLRDLSTSLINESLQIETDVTTISHTQLSRAFNVLEPKVLEEIFQQLLEKVQHQMKPTKRNSLYLIDSSTFSLSLKRHKWATFRKTKSGVKLHLNYCYMEDATMYPTDFTLTNAHKHDVTQLNVLVNQPETTYVFDRGYLDFEKMDQMHWDGYFFVTRIKKNTNVHVVATLASSLKEEILRDELVRLGSKTYLTANFRLVTIQDKSGRAFQFITNRMDCSSKEIADMYHARWQIELFFKHIKQHMTSKTFFSHSEKGVHNQLILTLISALLTFLIKIETNTKQSVFQIKRFFRYLLFRPVECWLEKLIPT
ncbi:IS4 family transposase [Enterococcus sp. BWT-B8]|uniref:IS4 family transposase n=1 Tax=Enterococcus sp. BWT-B8 TaxID=2885157 RepID=UPI001E488E30|nr:IS4 family transposase [Enterococcus sp. BWT-B8]MCB5950444.1 IS4 family transposase [Enterococcus sp. BWT-B8]